jgi:hypothetical protein
MRKKLEKFGYNRYTFFATFERYGSKKNHFSIIPEVTMLFKNIRRKSSKDILADHIWLKCGKRMEDLGVLNKGDIIQFDARVTKYIKGYHGVVAQERGEEWSQEDWRLSTPTNVKIHKRQKTIAEAANVTMQV